MTIGASASVKPLHSYFNRIIGVKDNQFICSDLKNFSGGDIKQKCFPFLFFFLTIIYINPFTKKMKSVFATIFAITATIVSAQVNIVSITSPLTGTIYTAGESAKISW